MATADRLIGVEFGMARLQLKNKIKDEYFKVMKRDEMVAGSCSMLMQQ